MFSKNKYAPPLSYDMDMVRHNDVLVFKHLRDSGLRTVKHRGLIPIGNISSLDNINDKVFSEVINIYEYNARKLIYHEGIPVNYRMLKNSLSY